MGMTISGWCRKVSVAVVFLACSKRADLPLPPAPPQSQPVKQARTPDAQPPLFALLDVQAEKEASVVAVVGGGNLGLETDQHIVLDRRPLRDLYATLMNDVYGLAVRDFGQNLTGAPFASITNLLKG